MAVKKISTTGAKVPVAGAKGASKKAYAQNKPKTKAKPKQEPRKPSSTQGFQKGHKSWMNRATNGGPKKYETSEALVAACVEYFEWMTNNPMKEEFHVSYKGYIKKDKLTKMRAMSKSSLYLFLNIDRKTWEKYGSEGHDYEEVVEWANNVIYAQKFEGAAAGLLNASLIARDLNIRDESKIVTDDGKGGDAPIGGPVLTLPDNGRAVHVGELPEEEKE